MESKIGNPQVADLANTLALHSMRAPTASEILQAMQLAYDVGKNDGAIEACDKMLQTLPAAA